MIPQVCSKHYLQLNAPNIPQSRRRNRCLSKRSLEPRPKGLFSLSLPLSKSSSRLSRFPRCSPPRHSRNYWQEEKGHSLSLSLLNRWIFESRDGIRLCASADTSRPRESLVCKRSERAGRERRTRRVIQWEEREKERELRRWRILCGDAGYMSEERG